MKYRKAEIERLNLSVRWLNSKHAKNAYDFAAKYSATDFYGLNSEVVESIFKLEIESDSIADAWLKSNFNTVGTVQGVFSENEVFILATNIFLDAWQDIFTPTKDDAMVLHNNSNTVLFYSHEHVLEIGQRKV
ncbi:hypothetical protein BTJ40_05685 [Microbulbifer sp. A4B17]|uniref:hypothetical protein n=1 Tax=Microbulbifer sp. A4B17 TaxID=359370 RepID=UPI000D52D459|nr:hypothetical protein [Microbulbifer sp. A4B17]AWF80339.1 hypothetical protein BTJ40_05685 [Microbulbifer sp. A4B17]